MQMTTREALGRAILALDDLIDKQPPRQGEWQAWVSARAVVYDLLERTRATENLRDGHRTRGAHS
jgi:hypothetical protein